MSQLRDALQAVRNQFFACSVERCPNPATKRGFGYDLPELCDQHARKVEFGDADHHYADIARQVDAALKSEEP